LVVDDVVTSGSSLSAAGAAVADRGAVARLVAVASTPDRRAATVLPFRRHAASTAA
jgi:orotate phosphoribosyltransferase